ncbi:undecaprenyl/decaprenyl-phosphate alpha-N-acetylglucosaminyl 1-phosphate transferase [Candidatus Peregrinibacteria bacterium]|nr:undecaprenyl/decaprenyl-phosphate alpha-N-acetylglucosaminyl 1-phosphate transferase [Candidatus Peregrinibacteria bacterium]
MQYLLPAIIAFLLTVLGTWAAIRVFPRLGLIDRPEKYGLTRAPIPYPGGIVVLLAFLITILIFFELDVKLIGLLTSSCLLVAISFWDDRHPLPPLVRLLAQTIAAFVLVLSGIGILSITNPLGGMIVLDHTFWKFSIGSFHFNIALWSAFFTVVWLVILINAMNWLDGVSGLPTGMTAIGAVIIFFLSISPLVHQPEVAKLALVVAAVSFGFWLFDFYPPKILIGDSGAMLLGLLLASLAIFSGGKVATAFLVLGFPILDALYVGVTRLLHKQAPWRGGEWERERKAVHLHHRLLKAGLSPRQVLLFLYFFSAFFGILALFLETRGKFFAFLLMFGLMAVMGFVLRKKTP